MLDAAISKVPGGRNHQINGMGIHKFNGALPGLGTLAPIPLKDVHKIKDKLFRGVEIFGDFPEDLVAMEGLGKRSFVMAGGPFFCLFQGESGLEGVLCIKLPGAKIGVNNSDSVGPKNRTLFRPAWRGDEKEEGKKESGSPLKGNDF